MPISFRPIWHISFKDAILSVNHIAPQEATPGILRGYRKMTENYGPTVISELAIETSLPHRMFQI